MVNMVSPLKDRPVQSGPDLRERLEDVGQHLQRRLPARVVFVLQLSHHEVQVVLQLLPQRIVQQVLQVNLQPMQQQLRSEIH